jgi:hypothetical protein
MSGWRQLFLPVATIILSGPGHSSSIHLSRDLTPKAAGAVSLRCRPEATA